jgi:hypothetical protein
MRCDSQRAARGACRSTSSCSPTHFSSPNAYYDDLLRSLFEFAAKLHTYCLMMCSWLSLVCSFARFYMFVCSVFAFCELPCDELIRVRSVGTATHSFVAYISLVNAYATNAAISSMQILFALCLMFRCFFEYFCRAFGHAPSQV